MNKFFTLILLTGLSILFLNSCADNTSTPAEEVDYTKVPAHFPAIPFPANNPYNAAKVELGRYLFYEKLLSRDTNLSCAHCLKQEYAFADCTPISQGADLEPEPRNTMSLVNAAYRTKLKWDGGSSAIEANAYRSIFLAAIFAADTNEVNKRLQNHPKYPAMFKKAFGENTVPGCFLAGQAIATFARTIVSGNSRYDKYYLGDETALTQTEKDGMALFFGKANCSQCHTGIFFTDLNFHNTGLSTHYFDRGRYKVTGNFNDWGKFITPTLRNIEKTAPYYHDGSLATLEQLVEHYNSGGKAFYTKSELIKPLNLTDYEKKALIAFLKSLTDEELLTSTKYSKPQD